jgi:hypothetical protein
MFLSVQSGMKTPEEKRAYMREYARKRRAEDPTFKERCLQLNRESIARNKDKAYARVAEWRAKNKEAIAEYSKAYVAANADKIKEQRKGRKNCPIKRAKWLSDNLGYMTKYNREYTLRRYYEDPVFRLKLTERTRIRQGLGGATKTARTTHLLGCSWEEFRKHLESLFVEGMTWGNMWQWHIDHIRPLASFDLTKEEDQRAAFHFSNHQPLWAVDNLRKGAKWGGANV